MHRDDEKWRLVSFRTILPIQIRVLPLPLARLSILATVNTHVSFELLETTQVGGIIGHLAPRSARPLWFVLVSEIEHTRFFHVDIRGGFLRLIRPLETLINRTNKVELRVNVTENWITMKTIRVRSNSVVTRQQR
jgi:hypothetical protein